MSEWGLGAMCGMLATGAAAHMAAGNDGEAAIFSIASIILTVGSVLSITGIVQ